MLSEALRTKWTMLRFDFYVAGRVLWFNSCWTIGAMNFGYAAETTLKHMLAERPDAKTDKQTYKHNLSELVSQCKDAGILDNYISDDLVHYMNDRLHFRYPSQQRQSAENARERDHGIGQSFSDIVALDDAILHLDEAVVRMTGDSQASVLLRGAGSLDSASGNAFFHSNDAAVKRIGTARRHLLEHRERIIESHRQFNPHLIETAQQHFDRLLQMVDQITVASRGMPVTVTTEDPGPAATFQYPCTVVKDADGNAIGLQAKSAPGVVLTLAGSNRNY